MFIMIDNYDSFVYNLVHYIKELGEEILVFRNDATTIEKIKSLNPLGIILSPGPKSPTDSPLCLSIIKTFGKDLPILGVCLGHQAIAHARGGHIVEGKSPMHGKLSQVYHQQTGIFKNLPSPFQVTRYHSLVVDPKSLPSRLHITAQTADGDIMGIKDTSLLLEGVQFHPEAVLTEHGHALLANYIQWCQEVALANSSHTKHTNQS